MSISKVIDDINAAAAAGPASDITAEERAKVIEACDALRNAYDDTMSSLGRMIFAGHQLVAMRIAVGMKVFDSAAGFKGQEVDIQQLAGNGGDALLTKRIVRMLVGLGMFTEPSEGKFVLTSIGGSFVTASPFSDAIIHFSHNLRAITDLPAYLRKSNYRNPGDAFDGPFQFAFRTDLHCFDHLKTLPEEQKAFNTVMAMSSRFRGQMWFEFYPVEQKLQAGPAGEPLIIDIGGGGGHDLIAFKKRYPDIPGTLITQDIPVVIDSVKDLPAGIEAMKHDFFTPQPIKGAKVYYLRHVLHDWPDKQAQQILVSVRNAMTKDSILLIEETELPEANVPWRSACMDLTMMAAFSALERTREQFRELLESAGLVLLKAWSPQNPPPGQDTVYEAVIKA